MSVRCSPDAQAVSMLYYVRIPASEASRHPLCCSKGVALKKVLLTILVFMFGATMAFAQQNGTIGIYADAAGTDCKLSGTPGLLYVYFVHVNAVGAMA